MKNIGSFLCSSIGRKMIMAISGASLGSFLLAHLLGNSTTFLGREIFLAYAEHLHSLGPLLHFMEMGLLVVFIVHISLALILYLENLRARPVSYKVKSESGGSTIGSKTMPYSGVVILVFLIVHLKTFHFRESGLPIADVVKASLQQPAMASFYLIGLLALILHTSHGFWSIFQSLGVNHPVYNGLFKKGAVVVSVAGGGVFILIPLLALFYSNFLL